MSVPPLHPPSSLETYMRGDVTIHPSAAIAPGVLIQAEPNSRIIIKAGVCIGMGTVLHAYQGTLEIQESVNLGAGVLIIGHGTIGANACIGSSTTIFNCSIETGEVVPPGSLCGDTSRKAGKTKDPEPEPEPPSQTVADSRSPKPTADTADSQPVATPETLEPSTSSALTVGQSSSELVAESTAKVYGQDYLNHLLGALLPHRQALSQPLSEESGSDT